LLTPPNAVYFTYPPDLLREIKEAVGDYRVFPKEHHRKGNEQNYLDDILRTMDIRQRAVQYLLKNKPWDLFCVVFGGTDWAMHAYWKYHDQNHPFHDPEEAKLFGNALRSVYQKADEVLEALLETVDESTHVFVMSDHGAGPGVGKSLINNWLLNIGLLKIKRSPISQLKYLLWRSGFTVENIFPLVFRLGLMKFKRKIDPRRTGSKNIVRRIFLSYNDIDWSRTKAFTVGGMGQIHINLKGRHPLGCVEPGEEYENLCGYISERIKEITLPDSDQPFVKRVYRRDELFHGEHLKFMPDLILMPTDMRYLDSGIEFASNNLFLKVDAVSGAHRTNGVFIFRSPDGLNKDNLKGISIRDIAPTVLYLLGIPIPDDMDGRVITEIIAEEYLSEHPIQSMQTSEKDSIKREIGYESAIDEEMVRQRLADLGYLD
jgi:predicted AlkP superfamily phosphohydrolase/phosphomutase